MPVSRHSVNLHSQNSFSESRLSSSSIDENPTSSNVRRIAGKKISALFEVDYLVFFIASFYFFLF